VRGDAFAVRERRLPRGERLERRRRPDLDPAARELAGRVLAEAGRDLRQDLRSCVDQHPSLRGSAQARIPAEGVPDEVGELREGLDARVAGSDEDEGEVRRGPCVVELGVRGLQLPQHVVAEVNRVRKVLEAERVLGEPGYGQRPRHGTERDDELLVAELVGDAVRAPDRHEAPFLVDRRHASEQQLRVRAHLPERHDHVARLERARRRLREHRRVEHEVLRADDRRAAPTEQPCDVGAREAAARDQHATACLPCLRHWGNGTELTNTYSIYYNSKSRVTR